MPRPDDKPNAAKRGEMDTTLKRLGYKAAELTGVLKDGLTRREIAMAIVELQRKAKKAPKA